MKVSIELTPYNALAILSFCREFINEETAEVQEYTAINEAVNEYEGQIHAKLSRVQLEDALAENAVNYLLNKQPK